MSWAIIEQNRHIGLLLRTDQGGVYEKINEIQIYKFIFLYTFVFYYLSVNLCELSS